MAKPILFYAAAADLLSLCEVVEQATPIQYAYIQTYTSLPIPVFSTCRRIPDFGYAKHGNHFLEDSFVVLRQEDRLIPHPLQRVDGESIYSVSAAHHADAVDFSPGGSFGENTIIQGSLGTLADKINEGSLCSVFRTQLRAVAKKIGRFLVAPEALALLRRGGRLTQSVKLPATCDLRESTSLPAD